MSAGRSMPTPHPDGDWVYVTYGADDNDHVCEVAWEEATSPSYGGHITVTERCECGAALRTYADSIL